jgi:hypothetical protein
MSNNRRIISITPFWKETHILELRLGILENVVDHFYTIEATKTFQGNDKTMTAKNTKHSKHTVLEIEYPKGLTDWGRENYQRDVATQLIDLSGYNDDDIVLITDLDEIPKPESLELLREVFDPDFSYCFEMTMHYWYLNNQNPELGFWYKAKACSVGRFRSEGFNATSLRLWENSVVVPHSGWHWTYIGDIELNIEKHKAFAHAEANYPENLARIPRVWEANMDMDGHRLVTRSIDDEFYPQYLQDNKDKYSQYIKEL